MKKSQEYIYSINNFKLVKKDFNIIFKAMDFYALASILFNNDSKIADRTSNLVLLLKEHCIKEEV